MSKPALDTASAVFSGPPYPGTWALRYDKNGWPYWALIAGAVADKVWPEWLQ